MKKAIYKGFTLIELLVVISIIGVIVAFAMFGMQGAFEASRDTNRKSDLEQYELALEIFANNNDGRYPRHPGGAYLEDVCTVDLGLPNCPDDSDEAVSYQYISDEFGLKYAISADLEGDDDYDWMVCSGGIVGEAGQPSTNGTCMVGSVPGGGACDEGDCIASCVAQGYPGGSCDSATDNCECTGGGGCADSDGGVAGSQYIGGYVTAGGEVTYDWCEPTQSSVVEQTCSGGVAVGTPFSCDPGTICVLSPTGDYCPSSGGGCVDSDAGPNAQYIGGFVRDVNGVDTYDYCGGIGGSVVEQTCSGGVAVGTPFSCDPGTACVPDPTGAYCPSDGGGGGCDQDCNDSCLAQGLPGGSCDAQGICVCTGGGTCIDTDPSNDPTIPGSITADYCGGTIYDSCDINGQVIETSCNDSTQSCNQYPVDCPPGTACVPDPTGAYCSSGGGGSCDEDCNQSCMAQGLPGGSCDAQGSCVCT